MNQGLSHLFLKSGRPFTILKCHPFPGLLILDAEGQNRNPEDSSAPAFAAPVCAVGTSPQAPTVSFGGTERTGTWTGRVSRDLLHGACCPAQGGAGWLELAHISTATMDHLGSTFLRQLVWATGCKASRSSRVLGVTGRVFLGEAYV